MNVGIYAFRGSGSEGFWPYGQRLFARCNAGTVIVHLIVHSQLFSLCLFGLLCIVPRPAPRPPTRPISNHNYGIESKEG